jgi:hypothetical protein
MKQPFLLFLLVSFCPPWPHSPMSCGLPTCSSEKGAANIHEVFWKVPALGDNLRLSLCAQSPKHLVSLRARFSEVVKTLIDRRNRNRGWSHSPSACYMASAASGLR